MCGKEIVLCTEEFLCTSADLPDLGLEVKTWIDTVCLHGPYLFKPIEIFLIGDSMDADPNISSEYIVSYAQSVYNKSSWSSSCATLSVQYVRLPSGGWESLMWIQSLLWLVKRFTTYKMVSQSEPFLQPDTQWINVKTTGREMFSQRLLIRNESKIFLLKPFYIP